jgi:hypothetical protein
MRDLRQVIQAAPIDESRVRVVFDNGITGVFDCAPYMKESYWQPLKQPSYFRRVFVSCGTLCWPNDLDIDPEEVWEDCVKET